jgi:hypothetical protein
MVGAAQPPAALLGTPGPGGVHQDASHDASGDGVEMPAVRQRDRRLVGQPEIGLMDQRRGLQRLANPAPHLKVCQPLEFGVGGCEEMVLLA